MVVNTRIKLAQFWKRYAERHPNTPKAHLFREGYKGHNPQYWIEDADLCVKCWVTQYTAGVYLLGRPGESKESVEARVAPFRKTFRLRFEAKDNNGWCATSRVFTGGVFNEENWDDMIDWLEDRVQQYERILTGRR